MKKIIFSLVFIFLSGCEKPKEPRKAWKPASERTHKATTRIVDGNELIVIEVPSEGIAGIPESASCFVWRDKEFKSASIACAKPEINLGE